MMKVYGRKGRMMAFEMDALQNAVSTEMGLAHYALCEICFFQDPYKWEAIKEFCLDKRNPTK